MVRKTFTYPIYEVAEYINWSYFFHAWGISPRYASVSEMHRCPSCQAKWISLFEECEREKAAIALNLFEEAHSMLNELDKEYHTYAVCGLYDAYSDGDNLILEGTRLPLLRQQIAKHPGEPNLCLSDFVRPKKSETLDKVGLFATSVDKEIEGLYPNDPYKNLLVNTLADRLAEATAECLHEHVRKVFWGYVPDENLSVSELHKEVFQGIRPAVGYPSLPDQSVIFIIDKLLNMKDIGIQLTQNGAMCPHASVSGLMISHPKSHYFDVGHISRSQLTDYAKRHEMKVAEVEKFLRHLL